MGVLLLRLDAGRLLELLFHEPLPAGAVAVTGQDFSDEIHDSGIRHHAGDLPGEDPVVDGREIALQIALEG